MSEPPATLGALDPATADKGRYAGARIEVEDHYTFPDVVGDTDLVPEHGIWLLAYGKTADGSWLTPDCGFTETDIRIVCEPDGWLALDEKQTFDRLRVLFPGASIFHCPDGNDATLGPDAETHDIAPLVNLHLTNSHIEAVQSRDTTAPDEASALNAATRHERVGGRQRTQPRRSTRRQRRKGHR